MTTTRTCDALYRLTGISSVGGAVTKAYSYTYDSNNDRRTQLNMPDGSYWTYEYDDYGQVKKGRKYDSSGKAVPGQYFGYDYDGIGNLTSEQRGIMDMNIGYTANSVNQYTQRTIPGIVPVIGEADAAATVKASRTDVLDMVSELVIAPVRDGRYFSGAFHGVDNVNAARSVTYDVYAVKDQGSQQLINKQSASFLVPKRDQSFTYDFDGNMLSDGNWTYTWNGENRLISAVKANSQKVEFAYDYMGRRTAKLVYNWVNGAWNLTGTEKYVYDGCNIIAIYDSNDQLIKSFLWGEDLAGSLQGACGIGGLLVEKDNSGSYYPIHDGNGNIKSYVDAVGTLVAEYEYGPFGQLNLRTGSLADHFDFLFASKFLDKETNLYDYGLRHYSVDLMRWTSRDPLEEKGGNNLYAFVSNNPISDFDILGLASYKIGKDDPIIKLDIAGGSKPATAAYIAFKASLLASLPLIYLSLPHAAEHMNHYLGGSGTDISIDALDMVKKSVNGKKWFEHEAIQAKAFAETLEKGEYDITSGLYVTPENEQKTSLDWFLAVGGYSAWGKGHLKVSGNMAPSYFDHRCFELEFEYKVKDWYNFDKGKVVSFPIRGKEIIIKDEIMREFALQGLAREFMMRGSFKRKFTWKSGEKIDPESVLLNGN